MADLEIRFSAGAQKSSAANPVAVTRDVVRILRKVAADKGRVELRAALTAGGPEIVEALRADANRFASNAAKVFTRIQSPATGRGTVSISLDDVNRNIAGFSSETGRALRRTRIGDPDKGHQLIQWTALTRRTLANKRGRQKRGQLAGAPTTFFVDSGQLRDVLLTYLGPAMANLIDPIIKVYERDGVVRINVSVMSKTYGMAKAGVSQANLPLLGGADSQGLTSRNETIFASALVAAGAPNLKGTLQERLTNPRGAQRAFLQAVLAFWLFKRLPLVFERSLMKVLASNKYRKAIQLARRQAAANFSTNK